MDWQGQLASGQTPDGSASIGCCSGRSRSQSIDQVNIGHQVSIVTEDGDTATVSQRINDIGFGLYQAQAFLLCAGVIVVEVSFMQASSGIANAVAYEFGLESALGRSVIVILFDCGLACGTVASGAFGDTFGRRLPILIAYAGMLLSALMVSAAWSIEVLCPACFLLGLFAGIGVPCALIALSEVTPDTIRGVSTGALGLAWCAGELWAATGLLIMLPDLQSGPWRYVALWSAAPAVVLLILAVTLQVSRYDTPYFLAVQGRDVEMVEAIGLMAEMNGRPDLIIQAGESLAADNLASHCGFAQALPVLASWPYSLHVGLLCALFFAKDLALYGMNMFWPLAWAQVSDSGGPPGAIELVITASIGVPGVVVAMLAMYFLSRRQTLAFGASICAISVLSLQALLGGSKFGLAGVAAYKLTFPAWQMTTMLLPSEVFPTQARVWAWSFVAFFGRIATIIAPIAVSDSKVLFLRLNAGFAMASAIMVWLLPETKDCELQNLADVPDKDGLPEKEALGVRGDVLYGSAPSCFGAKAV